VVGHGLEHFESVLLPWEKTLDPNVSSLEVNVVATTPTCREVHCQIMVDGKVADIKADPKHATCTWKR
jgi:Mycobacterium membrane protein